MPQIDQVPPQTLRPGNASPLPRLLALRRVEGLAQAVVLYLAVAWLKMPLAVVPMTVMIALLAAINLASQWRLDHSGPAAAGEVFAQLTIDVGALAWQLYFAGGSTNPFVSLLLLPPTLAAALLPARHAWAMAGITLLVYTSLMFWNLPLPPPQGDLAEWDALLARATGGAGEHTAHGSGFALHVVGMWLNFVISTGVVAFFLTRMAAALRGRERALAAAREAALRNEQILSLGTLAAGAAHQLGTPLGTMAIVLRELELNHGRDFELSESLLLLRKQVDRCKRTLSEILASTGQGRDENLRSLPVDAYLQRLLDDWQLIRPRAVLRVTLQGDQPAPAIAADRTLAQALLNLLDNAADANAANAASDEALHFLASWDTASVRVEILDRGPGLRSESAQRLGEAFFSTKTGTGEHSRGIGIGLFLTNATIERLGGRVELFSRDDPHGGACTRVTLPLPLPLRPA